MEICLVHPMASLLSAYGMGLADIRAVRAQAVEAELSRESRLEAAALIDALGVACAAEVEAQGVPPAAVRLRASLFLKVKGTDTALEVGFDGEAAMRAAFAAAHRARFGFDPGEAPLVIEAAGAEAVGGAADVAEPEAAAAERGEPEAALVAPVWLGGGWRETRFVRRAAMAPGARLAGPAVLVEPHTVVLVEPGWQARITAHDHVELRRVVPRPEREAVGTRGRPGDARGVQQPLHVDRRADGGGAGEHRGQRDDQGAAGLLLRGVRREQAT